MDKAPDIIARMLDVPAGVIERLDARLSNITGRNMILERIVEENEALVEEAMRSAGVAINNNTVDEIQNALMGLVVDADKKLFEYFDKPDLSHLSNRCGKLCEIATFLSKPGKGYFIKKEKAISMLNSNPPKNLLDHFGVSSVVELVERHGFAPVFSALRFTQTQEWMHSFFDVAYKNLSGDDFEERDVEIIVLNEEWLKAAEKFLKKKYHNVSHLKEFGIIFIVPIPLDSPGETLRMFMLLLHYLNEVPFYSKLIKKYSKGLDFVPKLQSLLRGDVLEERLKQGRLKFKIRIVQRYLAKDDETDFRLFEPHINPEAEHWYRAEGDLEKLVPGKWQALDYVGKLVQNEFLSFSLIDQTMSLVKKCEIKYLYHHREALWNKIFMEYLGRDKVNDLIEKNIIKGFIEL